jgi:hypothetical protein
MPQARDLEQVLEFARVLHHEMGGLAEPHDSAASGAGF